MSRIKKQKCRGKDCKAPVGVISKSLCMYHYHRDMRGLSIDIPRIEARGFIKAYEHKTITPAHICGISKCGRVIAIKKHKLCALHYVLYKNGENINTLIKRYKKENTANGRFGVEK